MLGFEPTTIASLLSETKGLVYRCRLDDARTMEFISHGSEAITGYPAADLVGSRRLGFAELIHPGDRDRVRAQIGEAVSRREAFQVTYRLVTAAGDERVVWEQGQGVSSDDGDPAVLEGFITDVTEVTEAQQRSIQLQRIESLGQLAGGVAHDFNNVLQTILNLSESIRQRLSDPFAIKAILDDLDGSARRGAQLARQLLLFARRETARPEFLDVNAVVEGSARMLRRLVRENVGIDLHLESQPMPVRADRGQLEQVLMNLVLNAADAMPAGGTVTVATRWRSTEEVELSVADTGGGIPEAVQRRIFEPFFTTKSREYGTGLGLAVVHGIVTRHRGRIELESREGVGSRFTVVLPVSRSGEFPVVHPDDEHEALPRGRGELILVVEDEAAARESLREILEMLGYAVTAVGTAGEAGDVPRSEPVALLLTDYLLPDATGIDLAFILELRWPRVPVVVMSGYADDVVLRSGVEAGVVRFLQKPFAVETLAREIRLALDAGR